MPLPTLVSGTCYKGPFQGYVITTATLVVGSTTVNLYVSDGAGVAASETITITHASGSLTVTTDSSGQYSIDISSLSPSVGDSITVMMDTRQDKTTDPQDCSKIMLRDERGKVHDDDYPFVVRNALQIGSELSIGNFDQAWTITRSDGQPSSETITLPDSTSYTRTFTYNSSNFLTARSKWNKN